MTRARVRRRRSTRTTYTANSNDNHDFTYTMNNLKNKRNTATSSNPTGNGSNGGAGNASKKAALSLPRPKRGRRTNNCDKTIISSNSHGTNGNSSNDMSQSSSQSSQQLQQLQLVQSLTHPNQLKWHKNMRPGSSIPLYLPCRVVTTRNHNGYGTSHGNRRIATTTYDHDSLSFHSNDNGGDDNDDDCDDDDDDDDDEEVQIEYITPTNMYHFQQQQQQQTNSLKFISKKRLIPYYGTNNNNKNDDNSASNSFQKWNESIYNIYCQQFCKEKENYDNDNGCDDDGEIIELSYLNNILNETKVRAGYNNDHDDHDVNDDDKDHFFTNEDDLEEPYTQALDFKSIQQYKSKNTHDDDDDDDDDSDNSDDSDDSNDRFFSSNKEQCNNNNNTSTRRSTRQSTQNQTQKSLYKKKFLSATTAYKKNVAKEPILPGDVIEYYHPIYVFGDSRGKRIATVISIDPKNKSNVLTLSNDECLALDDKVKRIKTLITISKKNDFDDEGAGEQQKGMEKRVLIDHRGIFRQIQEFKLLKHDPIKDYEISTERDRVKDILEKNVNVLRIKAEESGFAPMDMIRSFGSKGSNNYDNSYDSSCGNKIGANCRGKKRHHNENCNNNAQNSKNATATCTRRRIVQRKALHSDDDCCDNSYDDDNDDYSSSSESDNELKAIEATHDKRTTTRVTKKKKKKNIPKQNNDFSDSSTSDVNNKQWNAKVQSHKKETKHKQIKAQDNMRGKETEKNTKQTEKVDLSSSSSESDCELNAIVKKHKMEISAQSKKKKNDQHNNILHGSKNDDLPFLSLKDTDDEGDDIQSRTSTIANKKGTRVDQDDAKEESFHDKELEKQKLLEELGLMSDSDDDEVLPSAFTKKSKDNDGTNILEDSGRLKLTFELTDNDKKDKQSPSPSLNFHSDTDSKPNSDDDSVSSTPLSSHQRKSMGTQKRGTVKRGRNVRSGKDNDSAPIINVTNYDMVSSSNKKSNTINSATKSLPVRRSRRRAASFQPLQLQVKKHNN